MATYDFSDSSPGRKSTPSQFTPEQKLRRLYAAHKAYSRCLNIQIDALRKVGLAAKKNDMETVDLYIDVCKRISRRLPRIGRAIDRLIVSPAPQLPPPALPDAPNAILKKSFADLSDVDLLGFISGLYFGEGFDEVLRESVWSASLQTNNRGVFENLKDLHTYLKEADRRSDEHLGSLPKTPAPWEIDDVIGGER